MGEKFAVPTDPEIRMTWVIGVSAVAVLVLLGRVFRDVNPS